MIAPGVRLLRATRQGLVTVLTLQVPCTFFVGVLATQGTSCEKMNIFVFITVK